MDEASLIATYFAPLAGPEGLSLLDDAALYTPEPGFDLVISTDTFVEGVHVPTGRYGAAVAERLIRANISDLAAKGAEPCGYTLNIAMPAKLMPQWIPAFAKGLEETQRYFGLTLWGGDTTATEGPAVFTLTVFGRVAAGQMIQRTNARVGDDVWLTGKLGDAMLGCYLATQKQVSPAPTGADIDQFETAYWRPETGHGYLDILRQFARGSADLSDGLLVDAASITAAAGQGCATLNFDALPYSLGAETWAEAQSSPIAARQALASYGEDYSVIFTADANHRTAIFDAARKRRLKLSLIGSILPGEGAVCLDVNGQTMDWPHRGYSHL